MANIQNVLKQASLILSSTWGGRYTLTRRDGNI